MSDELNPAVVQEPAAPEAKSYKVPDDLNVPVVDASGDRHWPGETFEAVFPPDQEARLVRRGQITPVVESAGEEG